MKTQKINPLTSPNIRVMGLPFHLKDTAYLRFPKSLFKDIIKENPSLEHLGYHMSGVCFEFITDSSTLTFEVNLKHQSLMNHMPISGESGFDVYVKDEGHYRFLDVARPNPGQKVFTYEISAPITEELSTYLIYAPLYNGIESFHLNIDANAQLIKPSTGFQKKWLFYGTSITQGACASRAGMSYPAIIGRNFDVEIINYGFSGNGLGEKSVMHAMQSIGGLDKIFIDYEANAGSANLLVKTLEPLIKGLREAHQNTPIYVMTRIPFPKERYDQVAHERRLFHKAFQKAFVDEHQDLAPLYFIDGDDLHTYSSDLTTVDGIHLTDLGFYHMATNLTNILKKF
jgi:hypothetical protein